MSWRLKWFGLLIPKKLVKFSIEQHVVQLEPVNFWQPLAGKMRSGSEVVPVLRSIPPKNVNIISRVWVWPAWLRKDLSMLKMIHVFLERLNLKHDWPGHLSEVFAVSKRGNTFNACLISSESTCSWEDGDWSWSHPFLFLTNIMV